MRIPEINLQTIFFSNEFLNLQIIFWYSRFLGVVIFIFYNFIIIKFTYEIPGFWIPGERQRMPTGPKGDFGFFVSQVPGTRIDFIFCKLKNIGNSYIL